jgi:tetratricopeptide (TPR) repeat protein
VIVPLAAPVRASRPSSLYDGDADETVILRTDAPKPRGFLKLLVTVLVAAVVAYAGILWQHHRLRPAMISSSGPAESQAASKAAAVVPPAPAAENAEVAEDSSEGGGSPAHGPLVEPIADSGPAEKVPLLGGASKRVAQGKPVAGRKGKSPAAAHAQGSQASLAKPNAPPALAAQGYVALNHRQPAKAIGLFKRALASNPNNGTALFGLAEAYRIGNQLPSALQAYRRYVDLLPSGPDAGSARYQIRLLENKKR